MTDVYLLIMDCLRQDVIDMEVDGKPLMPNLRRFREESVSFSNAFASAPSTHFAVPAILTGLLPFTLDDKQGINENAPYLPEVFRKNGYRTLGYTTNAVTSNIFGYSRGFDRYRDFLSSKEISRSYRIRKKLVYLIEKASSRRRMIYDIFMAPITLYSKMTGWKLNPEETNYKVLDIFDGKNILNAFGKDLTDDGSADLFAFLHFVDTHAPYAPPEKYMKGLVKEKYRKRSFIENFFKTVYTNEGMVIGDPEMRKRNWNLYLSSCIYQDELFKQFLDILGKKEDPEDRIIVVLSDHGEAFGRHGYLQHQRTKFSRPHIQIPLMINGPGLGNHDHEDLIDETDIFNIIEELAIRNTDLSPIPSLKEDRDMVLTLGYSGTFSITTRKVRFISDDEGERIFDFEDRLEENPKRVNDDVSSFFKKQASLLKKKMKRRLDPKKTLVSNIRSMDIARRSDV